MKARRRHRSRWTRESGPPLARRVLPGRGPEAAKATATTASSPSLGVWAVGETSRLSLLTLHSRLSFPPTVPRRVRKLLDSPGECPWGPRGGTVSLSVRDHACWGTSRAPGTWLALEAPPCDRGYCVLRRCTRASAYATRCRSAIGRLVTFPVLARLRPPPMATNVTLGYASRWRLWGVALWPWLAHVRPTQESSSGFHLRARYAFPRVGMRYTSSTAQAAPARPTLLLASAGRGS